MRHQKFTLAVTMLALLVGCAFAQAQAKATVDIKFKFIAGTAAMAPGNYNIEQMSTGSVSIREAGGGKSSAVLPIITVLGRHDNDQFPELVFDLLPDGPHLSEVWFSGGVDGMLVLATKEPHKHQVLQAK